MQALKKEICYSKLYFANRRNNSWGAYSQTLCELDLLKYAFHSGVYQYFHLLSGSDLPIKNQDYIHLYFTSHQGEEFIHFSNSDWLNEVMCRLRYYYPIQELAGKIGSLKVREFFYKVQKVFVIIQKQLGVDRLKNCNVNFYGGSNWFSITTDCAKYVLENAQEYLKLFRMTSCSDEFLLQTIIANSPLIHNIHQPLIQDGCHSNMRLRIWIKGTHPKVLGNEDFSQIVSSDLLFARKFDYNQDEKFFLKVVELTKKESSVMISDSN